MEALHQVTVDPPRAAPSQQVPVFSEFPEGLDVPWAFKCWSVVQPAEKGLGAPGSVDCRPWDRGAGSV